MPDLSVPIRLPSIKFWVDVWPSISMPTRLPEITCAPWLSPSIVFSGGIVDLNAALGVAQVGRASEVGADQIVADDDPVADAPEMKTPIKLAEITLPGPITVPGE